VSVVVVVVVWVGFEERAVAFLEWRGAPEHLLCESCLWIIDFERG